MHVSAGGERFRAFEGRLVEIHSLSSELQPNEETKKAVPGAGAVDFNGHRGLCWYWDLERLKYVVLTFEGLAVGVLEENLAELRQVRPEEGGFDVTWPVTMPEPYLFAEVVAHCLAEKGYCVVQMFTSPNVRKEAAREARDAPAFDQVRAELEVAYLGQANTTYCGVLQADHPERDIDDGLAYCDRDLTTMGMLLSTFSEQVFGYDVADRSNALVRVSGNSREVERSGELSDQDVADQLVESFVGWILRRKLCLIYLVENEGGVLELHPKTHFGSADVKLPLQRCRMVIFRHEDMGYSYRPEGDSVALQTWLLEEAKAIEFRELAQPPGRWGLDRVHVAAAYERFPAECEGCNMTLAMFNAGTDALTRVPLTRFDMDLYWMDDRDAIMYGKAYVMHGSFCNDYSVVSFDNAFFGFSEEEAKVLAPSQRMVMEVGFQTLYNGGWTKKEDLNGQRVGTFLGDSGCEWNQVYFNTDAHCAHCNNSTVTSCRLSYVLGLRGPNVTVDTACSASLVAANVACHWMRCFTFLPGDREPFVTREKPSLNKSLCMGILVMVSPAGWIGECAATMLSMRGRCFTFDSSADGFTRGEGCCAAYLRTQSDVDQEWFTNRPLAVVMGTCVNQDGKSASLTAPHGPSQQLCIRQCLREAALQPGDVVVGEMHGTGTALGDPIEVGSVRGVMYGKRELPITHVTAKAHVGHTEANAGLCGLVKIILMLNAATITPNPHLRALNAHLDVNGYPVIFNTELSATGRGDQIFGVSSFGFGGTNSRAECWADAEKGHHKEGARTMLLKEEALEWITKVMGNAGTSKQWEGFLSGHKEGH